MATQDTRWVAIGPTAGTWWCVIDDPIPQQVAPGGVVLCVEQTITPHPDAERAAVSAWEVLKHWQQGHGQREKSGNVDDTGEVPRST